MYKVPKIGSWYYFCNILKVLQLILRSVMMQSIQIFFVGPVIHCYFLSWWWHVEMEDGV